MRILIVTLALVSHSPVPQQPIIGQVMLLDPDLPSVSLRFEQETNRTAMRVNESEEGILLRFYNNTTVPVALCTEGVYRGQPLTLANGERVRALNDGREIFLCYSVYEVQRMAHLPLKYVQIHTYSVSWVPSGSSVLFFVPENYLRGDWRVSVKFTYEWDQSPAWPWSTSAVSHQVFFSSRDLLED